MSLTSMSTAACVPLYSQHLSDDDKSVSVHGPGASVCAEQSGPSTHICNQHTISDITVDQLSASPAKASWQYVSCIQAQQTALCVGQYHQCATA